MENHPYVKLGKFLKDARINNGKLMREVIPKDWSYLKYFNFLNGCVKLPSEEKIKEILDLIGSYDHHEFTKLLNEAKTSKPLSVDDLYTWTDFLPRFPRKKLDPQKMEQIAKQMMEDLRKDI